MIHHPPRALARALGLSLLGATLVAAPTTALAAPSKPDLIAQLRATADAAVVVRTEKATAAVGSVRTSGDLFPSEREARTAGGAKAKASGYVARFARAFGAAPGELTATSSRASAAGHTVEFDQTYRGIPVFGARLKAQVDRQGDLTSVSGYVAPDVDVPTTPAVDRDAAVAKAVALASRAPVGHDPSAATPAAASLRATRAELVVYRMGAIRGVPGRTLLAWVVEVTDGHQVRETDVIDAVTGKAVNRYSMIAHALDRELHEASIDTDPIWKEGDDFPAGLDTDQASEVQGTGEAYWFFKNSFGRDSYDGQGATMITVNNDPSISCPNANWNGTSTNYCSGVSSDDTVAHEWGHAYTEYTSGLLYQWQPGAMNEAYSDIWGETVDMLNDRLSTPDETTKRTDGQCSEGTRGDITVTVDAPVGPCTAVAASFGPIIDEVSGTLVVGTDAVETEGTEVVGTTTDGCSPFDNAADLAGRFVYVDRGLCVYADKIENAEAAGAIGIVFGNNRPGVSSVSGDSDLYGAMVSQDDGTRIKDAAAPLAITLADAATAPRDASYRWLSGEDDAAFGGAIRDMWNPTCYGDPGKVSDEEYYCDTDDSGGVHTNSGVVNHAYALLVDGGTYNDVTVPGIGLDKAANIFWHTQTAYLTPTSDFAQLADDLEASCRDLTGLTTLKTLAVGSSPSGGSAVDAPALSPITADDCAAVAAAIAATELRVEPVQCNFKLLLKKGTVGCGDGTVTQQMWSEGFDAGDALPAGWSTEVEADNAHFDPTITSTLPQVTEGGTAHTGGERVLYFDDKGEDGSFGTCDLGEDDYSSRVGVVTPAITVPAGLLPRVSFEHYVATEVGFDGGNVKASVNGGAFAEVPSSAWLYNPPGASLDTEVEGSTNPMAGQSAFTGTDGGEPTGSWGTSAIDLSDLAEAGDTVRLRFDFGMDGCGGIDGWYVDNVSLAVCAPKPATPTTPPSAPAASPSAASAGIPSASGRGRRTAVARNGYVRVPIAVASGAAPTGRVLLRIGARLYSGTVRNGVLKVRATSQLKRLARAKKRKVAAIVRYPGDSGVAPFRTDIVIKVARRQ